MKIIMRSLRVLGGVLLCSAAVNAQVMTVALGSATPQVQFMNWAQEQAQNAAQKRFDVLSDAIKEVAPESEQDRKNHALVVDYLVTKGADIVHAARQESNKELTLVVPNTAMVTLSEELQQKLATVNGNAENFVLQRLMSDLKKIEEEQKVTG